MTISINKANFKDVVEQAEKPVIIKVFAPWCGPCQHMEPEYEALAKELADSYVFAKLNIDEARDIATQYTITSVPTVIFIKNNDVLAKEVGYLSQEDLKTKIKQHLGS